MRIWNGLNVNDKVEYFGKKYYVIKLYEESNRRVTDLRYLQNNEIIKGVDVSLCKKVDD